jgi:integrase
MTKALTAKRIENENPGKIRKEIPDGLLVGLYLVVQPSGAKSFAVRYRYAGQPRKLTLGAFPAITLEAARDIGGKALRAAAEGRDPATEKQAAKTDAKKAEAEAVRGRRDLFENVAREFIERHARKNNRETTWRETARILGLRPSPDDPTKLVEIGGDVMSAWRGRKIQEISKRDIVARLDAVNDRGAPIMANRVLSAVRKLFNWCVARDVIQVSPCTLVTPPAPERSRDRVLSDDELRMVWNAADGDGWPFGSLVKMLILTGQRLGEVGGMRWQEIDLENKVWTLPAKRVKNNELHEVPLSDAAVAIIAALPRIKTTEGYVFATRRDAAVSGFSPLPNATPQEKLRDCGVPQVRIKSPRPERPIMVSVFAPHALPKRTSSAKPRVVSAAEALAPSPLPVTMPAAIARTFFVAPPSSTPRTSVEW